MDTQTYSDGPDGLTQEQAERRVQNARLAAQQVVTGILRSQGVRGLGGLSPEDAVTALTVQIYKGEQPAI